MPQRQHLCRASQQEPAGTRIGVYDDLDRAEQFWCQLDFIDYQQTVMVHETSRVILGRALGGRIVEESDRRIRPCLGSEPRQRALACLTRAVQRDDPGVREGLRDQRLGLSGG